MIMKRCTGCRRIKCLNNFHNDSNGLYGKNSKCKECTKIISHKWYVNHKVQVIKRTRIYALNNPDKVRKSQQRYSAIHREQERKRQRLRYAHLSTHDRNELRKYHREYVHKRRYTNPAYRIAMSTRKRISHALNRVLKTSTEPHTRTPAKQLLGCSFCEYKRYLEQLFQPGMNWNNYGNKHGQWDIDHIIPCAKFDLEDTAQQLMCFNYKNTRPCWAYLNATKWAH